MDASCSWFLWAQLENWRDHQTCFRLGLRLERNASDTALTQSRSSVPARRWMIWWTRPNNCKKYVESTETYCWT